ncbi:Protein of unknown function [Pyronema omphalodes CBS 100304]|uniref:Uncharacterized protein n=1 Tax=Pyronema omphalodes (strain CBS 100304) TaxID=1076935 RepID=U4LMJ9_PYROM|nr:Protein of unknown function [Pyronema omphalodes CBS 100304]
MCLSPLLGNRCRSIRVITYVYFIARHLPHQQNPAPPCDM